MSELQWWQKAVFYQIYPRSFADGNGDGIGDLAGMIDRLDYVRDLGVDALWLSPFYPSPLFDCGYDIADYTAVAPEYGTLDEFRRFLDEAHRRGLRVILDLVLNHTSHEHPWFADSRSSRDNSKRDWYVWSDPAPDGGPPNNWVSLFGGPAWEYDALTGQYYYHMFLKEQPDLNWRNPEVKQALFDAARFWLEIGVDGFRLDAIFALFEHPGLPDRRADLSIADWYRAQRSARTPEEWRRVFDMWLSIFEYQADQPGVHEVMKELRALVDEYGDRVLIGETEDVAYHGNGDDELHLVFNFSLMQMERLAPAWVRANQNERLAALPPGAWPCNTLGNHDSPRVFSRYGDGENNAAMARTALALLLTLRGTPFLYNGEEIGMTDLLLDNLDQFRDLLGCWLYRMERDVMQAPHPEALRHAALLGRDKCRTPLQWSAEANAGFCPPQAQPWLPVHPNHREGVNVAQQVEDQRSLLQFYRRMLGLRRATPALISGDYRPLDSDAEAYLAFLRVEETAGQTCLVVLNMSGEQQQVALDGGTAPRRLLFASSERAADVEIGPLMLEAYEVYIAELE